MIMTTLYVKSPTKSTNRHTKTTIWTSENAKASTLEEVDCTTLYKTTKAYISTPADVPKVRTYPSPHHGSEAKSSRNSNACQRHCCSY